MLPDPSELLARMKKTGAGTKALQQSTTVASGALVGGPFASTNGGNSPSTTTTIGANPAGNQA